MSVPQLSVHMSKQNAQHLVPQHLVPQQAMPEDHSCACGDDDD